MVLLENIYALYVSGIGLKNAFTTALFHDVGISWQYRLHKNVFRSHLGPNLLDMGLKTHKLLI